MDTNSESGFPIKKIFIILVLVEIALLSIDYASIISGYIQSKDLKRLIDITLEGNLPTWFSSTQLLCVGITGFVIYRWHDQSENKHQALAWLVIAAFFFYMAIDDASQIHERIATALSHSIKSSPDKHSLLYTFMHFPSYYWQIFFLPIFGFMGLFMLFFLFNEFEHRYLFLIFAVGIGCYTVAVMMDYYDGLYTGYPYFVENTSYDAKQVKHISRSIEEFIEMFGTSLIWACFMGHLLTLKANKELT